MPERPQQRRTSKRICTSEREQGNNQKVLSVADATVQPKKGFCLADPRFIDKEFVMKMVQEEGFTNNIPADITSFQELAKFEGGKRYFDFVDNTMMIQDTIEKYRFRFLYVTGPRRFGKTINLSMFEAFMDGHCSGKPRIREENRKLFEDLHISKTKDFCLEHQQKYYVIKLNFTEMEATDMLNIQKRLAKMMCKVYRKFIKVCKKEPSFLDDLKTLKKIAKGLIRDEITLMDCLNELASWIKDAIETNADEGRPTRIALMIDEFDKPFVKALNKSQRLYTRVQDFMSGFFTGIKNGSFDFVFFTGTQSFPLESGSHCYNGFDIRSIFSEPFHKWYGFTEEEIDKLLRDTGLTKYKEDFRIRYNGYASKVVGMKDQISIYNPYSVIKSIKFLQFDYYWCCAGENVQSMIKGFTSDAARMNFCGKLCQLLRYGEFRLDRSSTSVLISGEQNLDDNEAFTFLLRTGYLESCDLGDPLLLTIPNWEIQKSLCDVLRLFYGFNMANVADVYQALTCQNLEEFAKLIFNVFATTSPHSSRNESTYNMLVYAMIFGWSDKRPKILEQERKTAGGIIDIAFQVKLGNKTLAYLIEFKYTERTEETAGGDGGLAMELTSRADIALEQIHKKKYDLPFHNSHVTIKVGMSFSVYRFVLAYQKTSDDGKVATTYIDSEQFRKKE
jgi:hypothetical protein